MKRLVRQQRVILEDKWDITICPKAASIQSSTILDTRSNEYQSFIEGMVIAFEDAGYELYNDPEYTHRSNSDNSQSWYYTFIKVENYVEIRVVVNVRISDHFNQDRPWGTADGRRARYVNRLGNELANEFETDIKPLKVPVNIVFNDENYRSYNMALFAIHDTIEDLEKDYADWRAVHGLPAEGS